LGFVEWFYGRDATGFGWTGKKSFFKSSGIGDSVFFGQNFPGYSNNHFLCLIEGQGFKALRGLDEQREVLVKDIQGAGSHALALAAPDLQTGINILLQSYGVGPLQANIVLLHWFENKSHAGRVSKDPAQNLRIAFRLKHNILMLNAGESKWETLIKGNEKQLRIDVWWWGEATSRLMLLLAYLLTGTRISQALRRG
jgi:hypothetical protein